MQTAAACCGLHAFRPTRDALSKEGVQPIAGELDAVGWICRGSSMLPQLGQALNLPGGELMLVCRAIPSTMGQRGNMQMTVSSDIGCTMISKCTRR